MEVGAIRNKGNTGGRTATIQRLEVEEMRNKEAPNRVRVEARVPYEKGGVYG